MGSTGRLTRQIGFHHLCSPCPDVLRGTDFEPFHDTFSGAWDRIVNAIRKAEQYGLGVLIDLHAVAGGQNNDGEHATPSHLNSLIKTLRGVSSRSPCCRTHVTSIKGLSPLLSTPPRALPLTP